MLNASPKNEPPSLPPGAVAGNDVIPGTELLPTVPYGDALYAALGFAPSEAYSRDTKRLVAPDKTTHKHGFVGAVHAAYASHYPLVLSPDMIWLLIAQGFALHVRMHAEELRDRFVAHDNKKILFVERADLIPGFAGNDWESVISEFSAQIQEHIGEQTHRTIVPSFSTTGIVERAAFEVTLMDAMQHYFHYVTGIICGIPYFVLEGTPDDWKCLYQYAADLQQYDLDWWIPHLLPVLQEFIATSEGRSDRKFWKNFYLHHEGGCISPEVISGHIAAFFPYLPVPDDEGRMQIHAGREDQRRSVQSFLAQFLDIDEYMRWYTVLVRDMNRAPATNFTRNPLLASPPESRQNDQGIDPVDLPSGFSSASFTLLTIAKAYSMEFLAGFVGAAQDENTLAIRPEIGWAVNEKEDG